MDHKLKRASAASRGLSPVRRPVTSNAHGRNDSTSYAPAAAVTLLRKQSGLSSSAISATNANASANASGSTSAPPVIKAMELQVVDDIMSRFMHDAMIAHYDTLFLLLMGMLQPSIESNCIIPCVDLITPIREMIAIINVPGVANNMDLEILLEGVILDIVHDSTRLMIQETVYADVRREMDGLASELSLVYAFVSPPIRAATQSQAQSLSGTTSSSTKSNSGSVSGSEGNKYIDL